MMLVVRLEDIDQTTELHAGWQCMTRGIPFRSPGWLSAWWRQYASQRALYFLRVTDTQGQVVGLAPWFLETSMRHGRVIRPLGCGEVCSDYLGILATREHEQQVARAIAEWLTEAAQDRKTSEDRWDLLDLNSADADDQTLNQLVTQLENYGNRVHRRSAMNCWRISLPTDWDEYLMTLSKSRRKRIRRIQRDWLESGRAVVRPVTSEEDLERGMRILVELHQRRRQSMGEPGCFASAQFDQFLHDAARRLFGEDGLGLAWLEMDGQPVAVEFYLVSGRTTYAYQAGLDPDRLADKPGHVMQVAMLRQAIEDGQQTFDFLRGDEPYKAYWNAQPRPCVDYRIVPTRRTAQLRHHVWLAGDTMKHWVKSGLHLAESES